MQICPFCASENIFFSKKRSTYICEDCDLSFNEPYVKAGMRVFISYGHDKNAIVVSKIKEYLNDHGYDVWIDSSEISPGSDWRERITNGIMGSNGILSFLSKHSVRDPGVCIDELKIAVCLKHAYLKTVLLESADEVKPPRFVANTQWVDLSDWESVPQSEWDDFFEKKMQSILEILSNEETVSYNAEIELLTKRLAVFDNSTKAEYLLKQVFIGREWLTKKLREWMDSSGSQIMMIFGVPGSGKSAFSANLSQYDPDVLGSIFFEWTDALLKNADYVTRLFALKLAVRLPDYRRMLCSLLSDEKNSELLIKEHHGAALFDLLIINPLQCCIDGNRNTYAFVFDGLDETSEEVSKLLIHKSSQLPHWFKIIFTSRYDETESSRFSFDDTVFLDNSSESNERDIEEYIACRLHTDRMQSNAITKKCEGSFMYAKTLCDSVNSGRLTLSESDSLPGGINLFYLDLFNRLFADHGEYDKVKTFLELLCIDDELPEELYRGCLDLDKYELWETRNTLKSLVRSSPMDNSGKIKTFKFVHKSIKDWLTSMELSGKYFIDPTNGYKALVGMSKGVYPPSVKFETVDAQWLYKNNYPKWLIKAGCYNKYRELLLSSFDTDEIEKLLRDRESGCYTYYYKIQQLWKWADMLPLSYPMDDILEKARQIVLFPQKYMVSNFSHRSFQISFLMLSHCMDTGRFAPVFFDLAGLYKFDAYFRSAASDDMGETRDGWDKYYMTRDAVICLKKCDAKGISVPQEVRSTCEKMKLSYHYYWGKEYSGGCSRELFSEPELLKDLCILPEEKDDPFFAEGRRQYNNRSLIYYLTHSDEEDMSFIKLCVDNLAELDYACEQAVLAIKENVDPRFDATKLVNVTRRIEFIQSLRRNTAE